jgi:alpha-glucosidase
MTFAVKDGALSARSEGRHHPGYDTMPIRHIGAGNNPAAAKQV